MDATQNLQKEEIDLRGPHTSFRYPAFAQFPKNIENSELESTLKTLVLPQHPDWVKIFPRLSASVIYWLKQIQSQISTSPQDSTQKMKVLCFSPLDLELKSALFSAGVQVQFLPQDPHEWDNEELFKDIHAAILSNPNQANGFFYPESFFKKLIEALLNSQCLGVLCDESLQLFSFSTLAPASVKRSLSPDKKISVCASLYPAFSPLGPRTSWLINTSTFKDAGHDIPLEVEDLQMAIRALMTFNSKQGATVMEFQRRLLALKQGLRRLTDLLQVSRHKGLLEIPHWPEAGVYLSLQISDQNGQSASQFCKRLFDDTGLLLEGIETESGKLELRLCFAAHERILVEAAKRLNGFLAK